MYFKRFLWRLIFKCFDTAVAVVEFTAMYCFQKSAPSDSDLALIIKIASTQHNRARFISRLSVGNGAIALFRFYIKCYRHFKPIKCYFERLNIF